MGGPEVHRVDLTGSAHGGDTSEGGRETSDLDYPSHSEKEDDLVVRPLVYRNSTPS